VKKECLPDDLVLLLDWMKNKKKKKVKVDKTATGGAKAAATEEKIEGEKLTELKKRDDLTRDYTQHAVVEEVLEVLQEERTKGHKFTPSYHTQVCVLMVNQFKPASVEDYRLKTNVLLYLIGTQFMTVRKDIGFFTKEQW